MTAMTPDELQAFEDALRRKWEAEKLVEGFRQKLLAPQEMQPAQAPRPAVLTPVREATGLRPQTLLAEDGPADETPADDSKYGKAIINFFLSRPDRSATVEEAVNALSSLGSAGPLRAAIVRAGRKGVLQRIDRGIYRLAGGNS